MVSLLIAMIPNTQVRPNNGSSTIIPLRPALKYKSKYEIESQSLLFLNKTPATIKGLSRTIIAAEGENVISVHTVKRMNLSMLHLKSPETQQFLSLL